MNIRWQDPARWVSQLDTRVTGRVQSSHPVKLVTLFSVVVIETLNTDQHTPVRSAHCHSTRVGRAGIRLTCGRFHRLPWVSCTMAIPPRRAHHFHVWLDTCVVCVVCMV